MHFFKIIEGAFALLNNKGRYSQVQLYARAEAVYAKVGSGYIRLGIGGATSVPNTKWAELDAGETAIIQEKDGRRPEYHGERKARVAAE